MRVRGVPSWVVLLLTDSISFCGRLKTKAGERRVGAA